MDVTIHEQYIPKSLTIPSDAQLIGIKSPKGSGKTELLAHSVKYAIHKGQPVLVPLHREQLAKEVSARLGVEYRTAMTKEGKIFGYGLCVNSLHPYANPAFHADDYYGALVLIDEVKQVF